MENTTKTTSKNSYRPKKNSVRRSYSVKNNKTNLIKKTQDKNYTKSKKVKKTNFDIKITPLGGVEEVAKNMYMVEVGEEIFVLDAGLMFPETEMIGIDAVIPDISYLVKNKSRVKGIFLSNGHVSSMGAIPYIIDKLKCPI